MVKLPVCKELLDREGELNTYQYCAPALIASTFFGVLFSPEGELIFEKFDDNSVRSGTLTFLSYKGECFAVTCKHVLDALDKKRSAWKKEQFDRYGVESPVDGYQLFTPIGNTQHHFNFKLTAVPPRVDETRPDVAIARVTWQYITKLGRRPLLLTKKESLPITGIATGYPEQQRLIRDGDRFSTFAPRCTFCTASMQVTAKGDLLVQDSVEEHNGVNVLSGMSGGPIIWSDSKRFGLAGIVREGLDIQPGAGQLMEENGIWIHGERITPALFELWLSSVPQLEKLKDESRMLHVPSGFGVSA